nr:hypothetical protein [Tanacetum cinerariifolium]
MHGYKKVLLSTMPASFLALDLLPFVVCSSNENHLTIPHKYFKKDSPHHMSPRVIYEIKIHGILLWASMGFFMPLGKVLLSTMPASFFALDLLPFVVCSSNENHLTIPHNYFKKDSPHHMTTSPHVIYEIKIHGILLWASMGFFMPLGILAVLLAFAGAILSIISFENSFNNTHQRIGLALYGAILVQTLVGFGKPKRGTKGRTFWYVFHWIFGTTTSLVGILNTYTEKWGYMQKQGEISGDEPVIVISSDHVDNQKEVLPPPQPSRKSNSLGNYFAKNNALNKLFQAT